MVAAQRASRRRWLKRVTGPGTLFVLPTALVVLLVIGYPFARAIWLGFTDKVVAGPPARFVWFKNYIAWAHRPDFWRTFENTLVFAAGTLVLAIVFGFGLALAMNRVKRGRDVLGAVMLFPWIIPTVISTLVWNWMYNPQLGVLNYIATAVGLRSTPIPWLSVPSLAMLAVVLVSAWRRVPYFGVTLLAGISGIPEDLYEAAIIDGASPAQRFWHITLPIIRGVLILIATLTFVETSYDFALVYILTRGGPAGTTEILSVKSFVTAFTSGQLGMGVAVPLMAFPVFLPIVWFVTRSLAGSQTAGRAK